MTNEFRVAIALLLTLAIAVAIPIYGVLEPGLRQDRVVELDARQLRRGAELYAKDLAPQYGAYGEGGPGGLLRGTQKLSSQGEARKFVAANADSLTGAEKDDLTYFLLNWSSQELRRAEGVLPEVAVEVWGSRMDPDAVTVVAGKQTRLRLLNFGQAPHTLTIGRMRANLADGTSVVGLQLDAEPGKEAALTFAPADTGPFPILCTSPEHGSEAIVGLLTVAREETQP